MTVKQVLVGTLLGSSIIALMVHRLLTKKELPLVQPLASAKLY